MCAQAVLSLTKRHLLVALVWQVNMVILWIINVNLVTQVVRHATEDFPPTASHAHPLALSRELLASQPALPKNMLTYLVSVKTAKQNAPLVHL